MAIESGSSAPKDNRDAHEFRGQSLAGNDTTQGIQGISTKETPWDSRYPTAPAEIPLSQINAEVEPPSSSGGIIFEEEKTRRNRPSHDGSPIQEKWAQAQELLTQTDMPKEEIAEALGIKGRSLNYYIEQIETDAVDSVLVEAGLPSTDASDDPEVTTRVMDVLGEKHSAHIQSLAALKQEERAARSAGDSDTAESLGKQYDRLKRDPRNTGFADAITRVGDGQPAVKIRANIIPSRLRKQ